MSGNFFNQTNAFIIRKTVPGQTGKILFQCDKCGGKKEIKLNGEKNIHIKCLRCEILYLINTERREIGLTERMPAKKNDHEALIFIDEKKSFLSKLKNSSRKGLCLGINPRLEKRLALNQEVLVSYPLLGNRLKKKFQVRWIKDGKIGLMSLEEKNFSPAQLIIMWANEGQTN